MGVGDIAAAIGFYGRAQQLAPADPRVKLGLAGAYVRSGRPVEALRLYEEADRAGATGSAVGAKDRGLAYDLVGDNARAQAAYRAALSSTDDEAARRMAISQAIAGDKGGFERTLLPLLQRQDPTAYRTRAFGLAILGEEREAVRIAEAMLPRETAGRVTPYLRYMPRLTRAQQAAAANLGIFPRAAQIGRDDPALAAYAPPARGPAPPRVAAASPVAGEAGARLAPAGEPLGARAVAASQAARQAQAVRPAPARAAAPTRPTFDRRTGSLDLRERQAAARAAREERQRASAAAVPRTAAAPTNAAPPAPVMAQASPPAVQQPAPVAREPGQAIVLPDPAPASAASVNAASANSAQLARAELPPAAPAIILPSRTDSGPANPVRPAPPVVPATSAADEPSLSEAFAEFALQPPSRLAPQAAEGIDITTITPPRERPATATPAPAATPAPQDAPRGANRPAPAQRAAAAAPTPSRATPAARPAAPAHPSRIWVQVATGRDRDALRFDWRRISRQAGEALQGKRGHVAAWGDRSRLLAGPFDSAAAARAAVTALREKQLDTLVFTSSAGEEITPIP